MKYKERMCKDFFCFSIFLMSLYITGEIVLRIFGNDLYIACGSLNVKLKYRSESRFLNFKKNNIREKFIENCDELLTCEACIRKSDRCGWCYSDGLCKSGNAIGATAAFGFCPYDMWEIKRCEFKTCSGYKNKQACITQEDCFWCDNGDDSNGSCDIVRNKYNKNCLRKFFIDDYFDNPDKIRNRNNNNKNIKQFILNQGSNELFLNSSIIDQSKNYSTNVDLSGKVNLSEQYSSNNDQFVNYKDFLKKLKSIKPYEETIPPIYDSINNPAGIFEYQLDLLNKKSEENINVNENLYEHYEKKHHNENDINIKIKVNNQVKKFNNASKIIKQNNTPAASHPHHLVNNTSSKPLLNAQKNHLNTSTINPSYVHAKKEIIKISKKIALEKLKSMFIFSSNEPFVKQSRYYSNLKEYKLLEKIAADSWLQYLDKKQIMLKDIRLLIGFYHDDPESEQEIKNIIEKVCYNYYYYY